MILISWIGSSGLVGMELVIGGFSIRFCLICVYLVGLCLVVVILKICVLIFLMLMIMNCFGLSWEDDKS